MRLKKNRKIPENEKDTDNYMLAVDIVYGLQ
jgi:hypothetical protein